MMVLHSSRVVLALLLSTFLIWEASPARAERPESDAPKTNSSTTNSAVVSADSAEDRAVTPEREAAAVTFAKRHHPELASLLESLKKKDVKRYESAIQELFRTSERLTKVQSRTPDRYAGELEIWKLESRIRLLAAQSVSGMPESRRAELKQLLLAQQIIKREQLEVEHAKLTARLEKLNESLTQYREHSDELAEQEMDRLLKSVKSQAKIKTSD